MKDKMSPKRTADDCSELKSILSDNRVNTMPRSKDFNQGFGNCHKVGQYTCDARPMESVTESSKCLKRTKEYWQGDKSKKIKFDYSMHHKSTGKDELRESSRTIKHQHDNKSNDSYSAIPGRNEIMTTASGFDFNIGNSSPSIYHNPSENIIGNPGEFYFQNYKTPEKFPDCTFSSPHLRHVVPPPPTSTPLPTNIYQDHNNYYNFYYYHHYYQQQQQYFNNPDNKDPNFTWDGTDQQINSYHNFGSKSFPHLDWYQYGDQWHGLHERIDQYAHGEGSFYYPFYYTPPSYNPIGQVHKNGVYTKAESEITKSKSTPKQSSFSCVDHDNDLKIRDVDIPQPVRTSNSSSMTDVGDGISSSSASPSSTPSSSLCNKSRDVDSTWSPTRTANQNRERILDLRMCPPQSGEKGYPNNWLAVDKTLVEDLIDNIMTGSINTNYYNNNVNYNNIGYNNNNNVDEEMRLAVL